MFLGAALGWTAGQAASRVNLAPAAAPATSYVSGHETLGAVNDGVTPRDSRDHRAGAYGNWPRQGTQWVELRWPRAIRTDRIEVYWWDDHRGVRLPVACRLRYWDGRAFVPVPGVQGLGVEPDRFNVTTFPELATDRLRLEFDAQPKFSTGILEWRVLDSGNSPNFPPSVQADVDRTVVVGRETVLAGRVTDDGKPAPAPRLSWVCRSGPGRPHFTAPHAARTTASFPQPGDYRVSLTADDGAETASATVRVRVIPPLAQAALAPVPTRPGFRVTSPFWRPRLKAIVTHWIPHCIEQISDPDLKEGGLNNFIEAAAKLAGQPHAGHRGYPFSNAWVHNTVEAICLALMFEADDDPEILAAQATMRAALEQWIPIILAAQEPDGYLQTLFTLDDGRERWSPRHRGDHEGYVAGYFLESAIAHHRLTGGRDNRLYAAAKRLADCWEAHIGPPPKQEWFDGHQVMEMALVRFGRYVNEVEGAGAGDRYLRLARFLLDCRRGGSPYDQSHRPVTEQYEAVGHAVRASYSYTAMADIVAELRDPDYYGALESIWDNLVNRKYYVTGGIGSGETSEGFGPDYSLRHNAYCESCSSCGEIFLQQRCARIHHAARYADLYETTLYNALLGSLDLEARNFYYQNPLVGERGRYPWHGCPCCVGNIPRTLLSLPTWSYLKDDHDLFVNLYLGGTANVGRLAGTTLTVEQRTAYPWRDQVTLQLRPAKAARFTLHLRQPAHEASALYTATPPTPPLTDLRLNGRPVRAEQRDGYVALTRDWQPGDEVSFRLPLAPQRIRSDDRVAANRDQVALRYGPLIYNFESVDQPLDKVLAPDAVITPRWHPKLLGGVVALHGRFADGSPFQAIPNYARLNRGGRSTVWIRER